MVVGVGIGLGVVLITGLTVMIYNQLVTVAHNVDKAWANIDVLLKQRHDELPKLIAVCDGYKRFEREVLERLTRARNQFQAAHNPEERGRSAGDVSRALQGLFAVAEAYPELKSAGNFLELQKRISTLEDHIADRREFYNESVNIYNIRIRELPEVVLASWLGYRPKAHLKVGSAERKPVRMSFQT